MNEVMDKDRYRRFAANYDRIFDHMNKGLKLVGIRLFRPAKGMNILDVGCGTGTQLKLYQRFQCNLFGIDSSPSMLEVARSCLRDTACLALGDATRMPYPAGMFDLAITMLTLHEMAPHIRSSVLAEIKRVLKTEGQVLLIDYRPGPYLPLKGWTAKFIITLAELAAGRVHYKNYRNFIKNGGLDPLIQQHGFVVKKQQALAGGNFNVLLAS
jgi:ubiquinone/menaquinone biosynthesis C-methylase UbiE